MCEVGRCVVDQRWAWCAVSDIQVMSRKSWVKMPKVDAIFPNASQKEVCDKFGMPAQMPEPIVALATESVGQSPIYGTRVQIPEGCNVSWFIHCGEYSEADDFYKPVHISHVIETLPQVLNYLCLPVGAKFIIDDSGYEDVWKAE